MKKLYTIEYYDYTGEDQKAYIKAESQQKAVDKLHSEYLVDGIWTINVKEIEQKKYKVRKAKKAVTTDKTRPTTNKTRHNTHKENKTMTPQIRITENIEGRTFQDSVFKKVTVTFEGKEVLHDCKDDFINMSETKIEIQLEKDGEFLKVYFCEYGYSHHIQPHVFIDGIATGFNQLGRYIDFWKIVINHVDPK